MPDRDDLEIVAEEMDKYRGAPELVDVVVFDVLAGNWASRIRAFWTPRKALLAEALRQIDEWRALVSHNPPEVTESLMYHKRADIIASLIRSALSPR